MPIDYFRGDGPYGAGGYGGYSRRKIASGPQYFVSYPAGYGIGGYGIGEYGVGPLEPTGNGYGVPLYGTGGYGGGDGSIGNLYGPVDGVNRTFVTRCIAKRMRVWLNGVFQTQNLDVGVGPGSIVFLKIAPEEGSIIVAQAWL